MLKNPSVPYIAPFLTFIGLLAIQKYLTFLGDWEYLVRVVIVAAVIWIFSRRVLDFRIRHLGASLAIGVGVFLLWIAPDTIFEAGSVSKQFTAAAVNCSRARGSCRSTTRCARTSRNCQSTDRP